MTGTVKEVSMEEIKGKNNPIFEFCSKDKENYQAMVVFCITSGLCKKKCSFSGIEEKDGVYSINKNRCDECGDCYINCPVKAISPTDAIKIFKKQYGVKKHIVRTKNLLKQVYTVRPIAGGGFVGFRVLGLKWSSDFTMLV